MADPPVTRTEPSTQPARELPEEHVSGRIPVFLCYRATDGLETAGWLNEALRESAAEDPDQPSLDVYFAGASPAYHDWTELHRPALERARAFIIICTPGLVARLGDDDWVHLELDWWLTHRKTAPILIDATGEGARWVPGEISRRWPNAQRIRVDARTWKALPPEANREIQAEVAARILASIRLLESQVRFEDWERQKRTIKLLKASSVLLVGALVTAGFLAYRESLARSQAETARAQAQLQAAAADAARTDAQLEAQRLALVISAMGDVLQLQRRGVQGEAAYAPLLRAMESVLIIPFDRSFVAPERAGVGRAAVSLVARVVDLLPPELGLKLEAHVGRFCVTGQPGDSLRLAPPDLPIEQCRFFPSSDEEMMELTFSITEAVRRAHVESAVPPHRIRVEGRGEAAEPLFPYPTRGTARAWNAAALQNNRILLAIE